MEQWKPDNPETTPHNPAHERERPHSRTESAEAPRIEFFDAIGRPDLNETITPETPWVYSTMELYDPDTEAAKGIKGGGGLGILAADTADIFKRMEIPTIFYTLLYSKEPRQRIKNFKQNIAYTEATPEKRGYKKIGEVTVTTLINDRPTPTVLGAYEKQEGSVKKITFFEPNIGALYQGEKDSDHRLYQEIALGFGEARMEETLRIKPPARQLNEAPTVFATLARLDSLAEETGNFEEALRTTRAETIYTNHTLVQAVEGEFTGDQFERFVMPNLKNEATRQWLRGKIQEQGGKLKLSLVGIELAGTRNGVSMIHAREAGKTYRDFNGNPVRFESVTNGISLARWGDPKLLSLYRRNGILGAFDLPANNFREALDHLNPAELERLKQEGRTRLRNHLRTRHDQYNHLISIPDNAKIYSWRRRIAEYKRPDMIFAKPDELARILEEENAHIVMAGRAHPTDTPMQDKLAEILQTIDQNPILKARVHFAQNYDEPLARALAQGADVALNTPKTQNELKERISTEACGTSIFKDMLGNTILISTDDGGIADARIKAEAAGIRNFQPPYLEITGNNYAEEINSLYAQMRNASRIINEGRRITQTTEQLKEYLPIISGQRMIRDYLKMMFPKKQKSPLPAE